jgi:16S rRNA (adenine1518-N6/adenine1519-N6)-dimethyltransferase
VKHVPRKRFGQHFLADTRIIADILAAVAARPGDHVVEIGPGLGALTEGLLDQVTPLHAIEIDRDLAAGLRRRFSPERLVVHEADALEFDYAILPAPLRLIGNLPYNISTPLLFHLIDFADRFLDLTFMLQREVVDRMVAAPSSAAYGRLSVMLQYRFGMEKLLDVPAAAFDPPPKVESAVVRLLPRPLNQLAARDPSRFAKVVTTAFTQRRKTLRNALRAIIDETGLRELGIDPGLRPENLAVADYVAISNSLVAS